MVNNYGPIEGKGVGTESARGKVVDVVSGPGFRSGPHFWRAWKMMIRYRKQNPIGIAAAAISGWAGCATVPEMAWRALEVGGVEQEVICSGACEEEWKRAEAWIKKHSGYPYPAEVVVTPDRIAAARVPLHDCVSVPLSRTQFLARCTRPPLASQPLGFGHDETTTAVSVGTAFADGGPHWTFLVLREPEESRGSRIHLIQRCWSDGARTACRVPGIREYRQDAFRRFVRTGEHGSQQ